MKKMIKYFLIGLAAMVIFTYLLGLLDDAFHKTGIWHKDIVSSIKYYVLWVLPYWWLIILIGSIILGLVFYGIRIGIKKLRG